MDAKFRFAVESAKKFRKNLDKIKQNDTLQKTNNFADDVNAFQATTYTYKRDKL